MTKKQEYSAAIGVLILGITAVGTFVILRTPPPVQPATSPTAEATTTPPEPAVLNSPVYHYIEITNGCGVHFGDDPCVNMRSAPTTKSTVLKRLRTGMVFRVEPTTVEGDERAWYKIIFDKTLRYPERVTGDWYVAVDPDTVLPFTNIGDSQIAYGKTVTNNKHIVINLTTEMLYAYDGQDLFLGTYMSGGLELTPTPVGTFTIFRKTPSRYMQGPVPGLSEDVFDLPGIPWDMYFTAGGAAIHGAYWHDDFGTPKSHGCVNLPPDIAKKLYAWADLGTSVTITK